MKLFYALLLTISLNTLLTGQWVEVTPPPANFRTDHTFGFAIDGTGYLLTGKTSTALTDNFYSFNPDNEEWIQLPNFPGGTRGFGIGEVWEEKAYFGFGLGRGPNDANDVVKKDLWRYDPVTEEWEELAECPCTPRLHPAFVTHNGNIYVGLGNGNSGNMKDWWQYNIETDTWTQKTDFPSHERHHPFQFTVGDYVYVGFGHGTVAPIIYREWYQYDPITDTWTEVSQIPGEGRVAGTQFDHNGYGYVLSGDGQDHQSMDIGEFWQYDADQDLWIEMPPHPGFSRWAPASFILNDEVYLINGTSYGQYQNRAYKYRLEEISTSVLDFENISNNIQVYPNPFDVEINIDLSDIDFKDFNSIELRVYDITGRAIYRSSINGNNSKLNMSMLERGNYIAEIYGDGFKIGAKTIVKQ